MRLFTEPSLFACVSSSNWSPVFRRLNKSTGASVPLRFEELKDHRYPRTELDRENGPRFLRPGRSVNGLLKNSTRRDRH
jgi:hypothetical protein